MEKEYSFSNGIVVDVIEDDNAYCLFITRGHIGQDVKYINKTNEDFFKAMYELSIE